MEVDQSGTITPKAEGVARITVRTNDGNKTATAEVQVQEHQEMQFDLSQKSIRIKPRKTINFKVYAVSDGKREDITKNKETIYEDESNLVTVKAGKVRAGKKEGTTVIKVSYKGETVEIPVTVSNITVTSLESSINEVELATEEELPLEIMASFSDKSKKEVTKEVDWSIEDSEIISVSADGILKAKKSGETQVIAEYAGKKLEIKVLVKDKQRPEEIKLSLSKVKLKVKKTKKLKLTAYYADGNKEVITAKASWTSEDESIATVKKGVITGIAEGTTVIKARYGEEELEATITVTR